MKRRSDFISRILLTLIAFTSALFFFASSGAAPTSAKGAFSEFQGLYYTEFSPDEGEDEGKIMILGFNEKTVKPDLVVPDKIDGLPVVTIGPEAFAKSPFRTVTLPSTLRFIGHEAFRESRRLTAIVVPEGVELIRSGAFSDCRALTSVKLPSTLKSIGLFAFSSCRKLTEIELPSGLKSVGLGAFADCSALTTVTLNEGLENVSCYAFRNCAALKSVVIPASVRFIGSEALPAVPDFDYDSSFAKNTNFGVFHCNDAETTLWYSRYIPGAPTVNEEFFGDADAEKEEAAEEDENDDEEDEDDEDDELNPSRILAQGLVADLASSELEKYKSGLVEDVDGLWIRGYSGEPSSLTIPSEIDGTAVVGISRGAFTLCKSLKTVTLPTSLRAIGDAAFAGTSLTRVEIPEGVTAIGCTAFAGLSKLVSVSFPSTLKEVYAGAFGFCGKLVDARLPADVHEVEESAFANCDALDLSELFADSKRFGAIRMSECGAGKTKGYVLYVCEEDGVTIRGGFGGPKRLTIPPTLDGQPVVALADRAFVGCDPLTEFNLPEGFKRLGAEAFFGLRNLKKVTLPSTLESIGDNAFFQCWKLTDVELPEGLLSIGEKAFCWSGLTSVKLPDSLRFLGSYAFAECDDLESAELGANIRRLPAYAFEDCGKLASVTLGAGVREIGPNAFRDCERLAAINIPSDVEAIFPAAFSGCKRLSLVKAFKGCKNFGAISFKDMPGCVGNCHLWYEIQNGEVEIRGYVGKPSTLVLPDKIADMPVVSIRRSAFSEADELTDVVLPDSLRTVGIYAFADCGDLASVTFGDGLKTIKRGAFQFCSSLMLPNFPDSLAAVGPCAFQDCMRVKKSNLPQTVEYVAEDAFTDKLDLKADEKIPGDKYPVEADPEDDYGPDEFEDKLEEL